MANVKYKPEHITVYINVKGQGQLMRSTYHCSSQLKTGKHTQYNNIMVFLQVNVVAPILHWSLT